MVLIDFFFLVSYNITDLLFQAQKFASGEAIFRMIDDDNAADAEKLITTCSDVCESFIETFKHVVQLSKIDDAEGWDQYPKVIRMLH